MLCVSVTLSGMLHFCFFFFSSRRRHTRCSRDWSSDVCSSDLTVPKGIPARNLPAIIFPHGGPWGRDVWGYNAYTQFFANRGYAVLSMNFRGSAGYGKKFIDAGNDEWGRKMQDDVTWGAKYLIAEGIADPKRVGIFGGSYGGEAALGGGGFTPGGFSAAGGLFCLSDLLTPVKLIPPSFAGRAPDVLQTHGRSDDAGRESPFGRALSAYLGRQDQDTANDCSGRQRSASQPRRIGTNCGRPA